MNIWILEASSGITLLYKSFRELMVNEDLVSGLLTALNRFTVFEFNEGIESIEMGGLRWVYLDDDESDLLFIAADSKEASADILSARLNIIMKAFLQEYQDTGIYQKGEWNGNTDLFKEFKQTIDEYYSQWKKAENITTLGEFFDILGVFQQILNIVINTIGQLKNEEIILDKLELMFEDFKNDSSFKSDPELKNISFSKQAGFNIIDINPRGCDMMVVERQLIRLIKHVIKILKNELTQKSFIYALLEEGLYSYIINHLDLLKKLNLDIFLLKLFLSR
ncbi:MAG: hypothetical protein EU541_03090 [Promethearchaeota archaeon]|nr:MAG: hypothetical protein EU541_03090 [Candidatus Lokiarchaeota archaeon]